MTDILLDYDVKNIEPYLERIVTVCEILDLVVVIADVKRTANGYHVYLTLDNSYTIGDIICIQALMGSDFRRESLNLRRAWNLEDNFNILFTHTLSIENDEIFISSKEETDIKTTCKLIELFTNADKQD